MQGLKQKEKMKKQIGIAASTVLGLAFAAAAIDFNGYNIFDRADGGNLACEMDRDCRKLTDGEIALAKTVFGSTVNYKDVKIFTRPLVLWKPPENVVARMWNGNIYLYQRSLHWPDLSAATDIGARKTFLHEMTHVWQYKNDTKFLETGFFNLLLHDFVYNALYDYQIDEHKQFKAFNFEQQGDIISDYYGLRQALELKTKGRAMKKPGDYSKSFNRETRRECQKLDQYISVISYSLPQPPVTQCDMYRPYLVVPNDPAHDDSSHNDPVKPAVPGPSQDHQAMPPIIQPGHFGEKGRLFDIF